MAAPRGQPRGHRGVRGQGLRVPAVPEPGPDGVGDETSPSRPVRLRPAAESNLAGVRPRGIPRLNAAVKCDDHLRLRQERAGEKG